MAEIGQEYDVIGPTELEEIKEALANTGLTTAVGAIQDYFEQQEHVELNIAVTGESGSGKSTFVNAFRGLGDEEEGSAPTGVVETTMEPKAYLHPEHVNVKVWDLPGIGTPNFKADKYLEEVGFQRYDFFIIVSSERFRECHVQLANEINKMKKKFYFIRSKIDCSISAESRKKSFNKEKTLNDIREDCVRGLESIGVTSPDVFLISCFDLGSYDFRRLQETMKKSLPQFKKYLLMLVLPNIPPQCYLKQKHIPHPINVATLC
ncbi:interferon-inducible GTPase 1-like [Chanos chanos]|uniref:Interferon-inducible GTPase 1-like n=1 Tax=Chanos chanos TaxID=29144 RepID=A0A6J2X027_CHACN|nr:interferon-inducible GTPase 1-like [Chanos chanos]